MSAVTDRQGGERASLPESRREWAQGHVPALGGIIVLAVGLRVVSAIYQGNDLTLLPGTHDQASYDALAHRVLAGNGFSFDTDWWPATRAGEPTGHWSFLYTLYLAGVYALVGPNPLVARLIQAVIAGVLFPWLTWRIGRRVFGPRVGLVAAALTAVYGYFVYYAGALMTETFYILAILWVLDVATGISRTGVESRQTLNSLAGHLARKAAPWVVLGLAVGTAVLLRQVILVFVPLLFAWLLFTLGRHAGGSAPTHAGSRWQEPVAGLFITTLVVIVMVAPWTFRNYQAFDRFVLLNTNSGYVVFWGNHPIHGSDFVSILPSQTYAELIPQELRGLDEAALDQALLQRGLGFVVEDPARYIRLSVSRIRDYFQFWPSDQSSDLSNIARILSFGILLPFMVCGLILSLARLLRSPGADRNLAVPLLYLFVVTYSGIHLLSWALIRYRLPVDAVLIQFAALGIVYVVSLLGRLGDRVPTPATAEDQPRPLQPTAGGAALSHRRGRQSQRSSPTAPEEGITGEHPWK